MIHIVDRFDVPWSGSALSAIALHKLLSRDAEACLWSPAKPHASYHTSRIRIIEAGDLPHGGTLIIHGSHFGLGEWVNHATAQRVILLCNVHMPTQLYDTISRIRSVGLPEPHLVFRSKALREQAALDGVIEPPLVDIELFWPTAVAQNEAFTIGRMSRDILGKHSEDDLSLYRMLAQSGCRVRIMGGTCLDEHIGLDQGGIELTAAGYLPAQQFLQGLDCFFYRTGALEEA
ncbi:MAG: hypothetical protein Q8M07_32520, partial [Prosthecobacter sp.]|nr:hypothetical protein [Prosthecobacter sp.]